MHKNLSIRTAIQSDLESVIALDHVTTREAKPDYWRGIFAHYAAVSRKDRFSLVAETGDVVIGFIIGEIRAWEFGSPPCGWVFALTVAPYAREMNIAKRLFDEISGQMKHTGVSLVRTMVSLEDAETMSFFRNMGLRTGRYIELISQI
ncbi:MAG TPA: GNAT family N-acetyltransferase [Desulfuromonadales bacterium]|nr:GNAT family N-acetyltransferase [Desulfuromonadales bacterium]